MPTPTGMLKTGDRIRHKQSGMICTVVKREGNDMLYSVILKPDVWPRGTGMRPAYGYPGCFRLLETKYWLDTKAYEVIS